MLLCRLILPALSLSLTPLLLAPLCLLCLLFTMCLLRLPLLCLKLCLTPVMLLEEVSDCQGREAQGV